MMRIETKEQTSIVLEADKTDKSRKLSRRRFIKRSLFSALGAGLVASEWETNHISVTRHKVVLPNFEHSSRPFRVVQLSDLHRSNMVSEGMIRRACDIAMAEKPDVIALTGDYVTGKSEYIYSCREAMSELKAPLGVWGILGNHDYTENQSERIQSAMSAKGMPLLVNDSVKLDNGVYLVGIDDLSEGFPDLHKSFSAVPVNSPILTLAHNPRLVRGLEGIPTIMMSGHTHGKQINIKGFSSITGRNIPYVSGWFSIGKLRLYVNRGIGVIRIPLRVFSPPEVTVYDFVPKVI